MANPNIVNITSMIGRSAAVAPSTTSATSLLSNANGSNTVLKVNLIVVANVNPTLSSFVTISLYSAAALGGTAFPIVSTVAVPADASIIVLDKPLYLEENRSLGVTAGTANDISVVCSYEEIS